MRRNIYFLLCALFLFGSYEAKAIDSPPAFIGGHNQILTICENSGIANIGSLLATKDSDVGQTETWSVVITSLHGTLVVSSATPSTGTVITPGGLSYTPAIGFSGTDSFSVRINDGFLSDTTVVRVLVNPLPAPITGTATICFGSTTTLADAGGGTWSSGSTGIATVDASGVVTGVATGNSTIAYTISTGCRATRVVTVVPIPGTIVGTTTVCSGQTASVFDGGGGAWTSSNTTVVTINASTGFYTGLAPSTSTITYTLPDGCATTTIITVNATPPAISGVSNICLGGTTTFTDAVPGGAWTTSNAVVASVSGGLITGLSSGTATITYAIASCMVTKSITVNPIAPVTGIAVICSGATTSLSDAAGGGTWSSSLPGVAAINAAGLVTGVSPGTSTITYALSSGCFSTTLVTVNAVPLPITGTTHVCLGSSITLSDAASGGSWTSGSPAVASVNPSSGMVTGLATGAPNITYSFSTGCKVFTTITINPMPAAIVGTMSVCAGQTGSVFDGGGGAWTSSNTSVVTINTSTGFYTGLAADTATVTYTITGGCLTTTVITVNPSPSAITGPSSICMGASGTLSDALPGGIWTTSNASVASIVAGGAVTAVSGGTATITYTVGACRTTKILTINPVAPITGVATICVGQTTTLADAVGGGMWSSAITGVASISSTGFVNGLAPGTAVITYALPSGCFTTRPVVVNPVPVPVVGVSHICIGATTSLTDGSGGGTWVSSNPTIASIDESTGLVRGLATGVPVITYAFSTGCKVFTTITIDPLPSAIRGTLTVCAGYSTGLTDIAPGGTWTSSNLLVGTVNPSTGYATGATPGTTEITYTLSTGCLTNAVLTVNANPSAIAGSSTVCQSDSTTLSDALPGGTWSTGSLLVSVNASTGAVTGITPGLATIVYTVGSCSISKVINVNPITPVRGTLVICNGSSVTLSDATLGGGTWSSSNSGIASITSIPGVITGISPGTSVITYSLPTGCSASATFTVNTLPAAILGNRVVCFGNSISLSDSTSGGIWTSSFPAIVTIDPSSGFATALATGTPTITYTLGTGCRTSAMVTVNPLPFPITGPTSLCPGITYGMSDGGGGTWTTSNAIVATANSSTGYVTAVSAGIVTVTYTINGCSVTHGVVVNPLPNAITGDSSICHDTQVTLSDAGGGSWTTNNETVAVINLTTGVMSGHAAGTATITYTLPTGCWTTTTVTVTICPVAVQQVSNGIADINVSPNPNRGDFIIAGSLGTPGDAEVSVIITNMLGQVVYTNNIIARNGDINEHIQAANNLANGIYILSLRSGDESKAFHVVIQR